MDRLGDRRRVEGRRDEVIKRGLVAPKRTHEPLSGEYSYSGIRGWQHTGTPLILVLTFKDDKRLPPRFLTRNQFVGILQGRYDPRTRRWHR